MRGLNVVNGDLVLVNGDFQMLEDDLLVSVERRVTTRLEEFFLDINMGLDHTKILIKKYRIDDVKQAIEDTVLQEERVDGVYDIEVSVDERVMTANFKFRSGEDEYESEVVI